MTGVWANQGEGWRLLPTAAYPDEATLHSLVEEARRPAGRHFPRVWKRAAF